MWYWIANLVGVALVAVLSGIALFLDYPPKDVAVFAAAMAGVLVLGAAGARNVKVALLCLTVALVAGCGITDPINKTTLSGPQAESTTDPGPMLRIPVGQYVDEEGRVVSESMSLNSTAGADGYLIDDQGIWGVSSQPKGQTGLFIGGLKLFSSSPNNSGAESIELEFNDAGEIVTGLKIKGWTTNISDPIAALDKQVEVVMAAMDGMSEDEKLRKVEQMRELNQISENLFKALVEAIVSSVSPVP